MEAETRFRAMGSDVHVLVVGGSIRLLDVARELVEDLEEKWSRFRPTSEISRLNERTGTPVRVSPETVGLVERALEGARLTQGRYDPTVLGAVLRAGYDRSFELLTDETTGNGSPLRMGYQGIEVDPVRSLVTLPGGVGFDPGGIGKGYAADLLAQELIREGAAGVCANLGGDLRVRGRGPAGGSWPVGIEHPLDPKAIQTLCLADGAVATSTRLRRVWGPQDERRHHLIDPESGRPAASGLLSASVVAAEGWQAEVVAKAAFVSGLARGLALIAATGTEGLLIDDPGSAYPSFGLSRFTGHTVSPGAAASSRVAMEGAPA
jgi:FAD:protein FMN transferase